MLADGGTMREELTSVVAGRGTGVRITWAWTVVPRNAASELAMPSFGWMWRGYARLALAEIETLLLSAAR